MLRPPRSAGSRDCRRRRRNGRRRRRRGRPAARAIRRRRRRVPGLRTRPRLGGNGARQRDRVPVVPVLRAVRRVRRRVGRVVLGYVVADSITDAGSISGALADEHPVGARPVDDGQAPDRVLTGLFLMASAGRSLSKALVASSNLAWSANGRVTAKVKAIAAITGVMTQPDPRVVRDQQDPRRVRASPSPGLSFGAGFVIYVVLFMLLMATLPRGTTDPGAILPGAALVATVIVGMQAVSQLYIPGTDLGCVRPLRRDRRRRGGTRLAVHHRPDAVVRVQRERRTVRPVRQPVAGRSSRCPCPGCRRSPPCVLFRVGRQGRSAREPWTWSTIAADSDACSPPSSR